MYLLILVLPFLSFVTASAFGRYIGYRGAMLVSVTNMSITSVFSLIAFYEVGIQSGVKHIHLANWLHTSEVFSDACWGCLFDSLTVTMLAVVSVISTLVHLYAYAYLYADPHLPCFLSYLSLFTFFMLLLVSANNYVHMFLGWEGVGIASYLLINFWHTRVQANKSAIKALLVNRVGDFALALAIFTMYNAFSSVDYITVFQSVPSLGETPHTYEVICILLFIGAMGKSAQLGLHTWLPDAMEGPTPVSALIHAATMVTAGVFLVARSSPLFEAAPMALTLVTCVGGLTAIFAATIGIMQNDIKRVIAYSTCSQLGYMFFACGLSQYSIAMYHLLTHAFFKAVLFLSAGALIHALHDEQDMRKMGGLTQSLPVTYACMFVGSLALMGTPFLAGYYSKESILEVAFARYGEFAHAVYLLGCFAAFLTAWYSFRLLRLSFYRKPESSTPCMVGAPTQEAGIYMVIPLVILAVGSIFIGYLLQELIIGVGTDFWYTLPSRETALLDAELIRTAYALHTPSRLPLLLSLLGAILGLGLPTVRYRWQSKLSLMPSAMLSSLTQFLTRRWLYDKITNDLGARVIAAFAYHVSFKTLDKGIIEIVTPYGIPTVISRLAASVKSLQSGLIYHYAYLILIALTFVILLPPHGGFAVHGVEHMKYFLMCVCIYLFDCTLLYYRDSSG